ncbi:MAG: DUF4266 domain-containing protein [Bacteroidia bacterium]|nr:DUF4266 domain-containing protein [Bacteroidia bacterium]
MAGRNRREKVKSRALIGLLAGVCCLALNACVSVEAYQKRYLNDEEMALRDRRIDSYSKSIHTYREGASGADGGKTGGGCGCN